MMRCDSRNAESSFDSRARACLFHVPPPARTSRISCRSCAMVALPLAAPDPTTSRIMCVIAKAVVCNANALSSRMRAASTSASSRYGSPEASPWVISQSRKSSWRPASPVAPFSPFVRAASSLSYTSFSVSRNHVRSYIFRGSVTSGATMPRSGLGKRARICAEMGTHCA